MLRLLTFGGLALERHDASPAPRLRPQRLAILAVLAAAGERGVSRERMSGLLWPDADEEHARHSLRQSLYALRQELGTEVINSDVGLSLDRAALSSDVGEFRAALAAGDRARAAALVKGPFLDGFYLSGAPEFERWAEDQRASLGVEATRVLLALTKEAAVAGDHDAAIEWWHRSRSSTRSADDSRSATSRRWLRGRPCGSARVRTHARKRCPSRPRSRCRS